MNSIKILCLIPARSGSKGIQHKNIRDFKGKPLISWTIEQAQRCSYSTNMRIIVSTDSQEYANIAKQYGAEVPFLRPSNISHDSSTDYEFISHAYNWLIKYENYYPDIILQLRPTQPCRKIKTIEDCLKIFIDNYKSYDSLRSVIETEKSPFKMYLKENNYLKPLFYQINDIKEPYNQCRQFIPRAFLHNGYIDILKPSILKKKTISGDKIYPFIMNKTDSIDIDTEEDWYRAESNYS